ncbi:sigma-54-dependent transcriptional regulator [Candidatus Poribacteria bacterium]
MNEEQTKQPQILIVDDVPANLKVLRDALEPAGYNILAASNGEAALRIAGSALPDIILLDVMMPPGIDGYEVCHRLKQNEATQHIPVIFITMKDEKESLVEGFRAGGVDYITKPFEAEEVHVRVENHLEISRLTRELLEKNRELQEEITRREQAEDSLLRADEHLALISQQEADRWGIQGFVGQSNTISGILDEIRRLQNTETTSVLITGESGTGKELIARAIHFGGTRAKGPFIPVNCSAIPRELADSAFFGHIRGAFTGANANQKGCFELADGGTLFLDEIGDMPLELQPKLLRVIETGFITSLGSAMERHVDVRVLAATNQNLQEKIAENSFREDLYFRLAGYTVTVPPLRDRKEDVPLLAEHFLSVFTAEMGVKQPILSSDALSALEEYHFPGNVRELKNIIENALIKNGSMIIKPESLNLMSGTNMKRQSDVDHRRELVVKRSQSQDTDREDSTHEEKILSYVEEHGSINNSECREMLSSDLHHASYLLKKLTEYGLLESSGTGRWTRYCLP